MKRVAFFALLLAGCSSSTEPEPDPSECEPMPWCEAFEDDVVIEELTPWPDSIDPSTGLPWSSR